MRLAVFALLVVLTACRRDAATGTTPAGNPPRSAARPSPAGQTLSISDEELVAYTRWQRDHVDLLRRQREAIDAVGNEDPNLVIRDPKAIEAKVAEVVAATAPLMKAQLARVPLKGAQADLVTEALGGLFHFGTPTATYELVIARDEVRLEAARRRFGKEAVDDIVAREALVLAALDQP